MWAKECNISWTAFSWNQNYILSEDRLAYITYRLEYTKTSPILEKCGGNLEREELMLSLPCSSSILVADRRIINESVAEMLSGYSKMLRFTWLFEYKAIQR